MKPSANPPPYSHRTSWASRVTKNRLRIVRWLVLLLFLSIIFQGALRKWLFPQLASLIFFSSDIVGLPILFLTWQLKLIPTKSWLFRSFVVLSLVAGVWGLVQVLVLGLNTFIVLYGWRSYFFYGYLAFAIGAVLDGKTIFRLARMSILINIPMAILSTAQYNSPADAFVNKLHVANVNCVGFDTEHTRCTLTFTDRGQPPLYLAWIAACLIASALIKRGQRPVSLPILLLSSMAFVAILMENGSRMSFAYAGIVAIYAFSTIFAIQQKGYKLRCILGFLLLTLSFGVSSHFFFHDATESMANRQEKSVDGEGDTSMRALRQSTSFLHYLDGITPLGFGLGLGSAGGGALYSGNMVQREKWLLAEDEWARILQELGLLGFLLVVWRVSASAYITIAAFRAAARSSNPLPLALAGYAAVGLFNGHLAAGNSGTQIMWFCFGVCLALSELAKEDRPVVLLEKQLK